MLRRFEINVQVPGSTLPCRLVLIGLVLVSISCSPMMVHDEALNVNPIQVLDESPRVYHIRFEPMADSVETVRAVAYLNAGLGRDRALGHIDSELPEDQSPRALATREYLKARRRLEIGASGAAAKHIKRALDLDPSFIPPYILLGNILLTQHKVSEATELFAKVVSWDVTNSEALVGLARSYMLMGRLNHAKKALVDAVIFDRVNLEAWKNLDVLGAVQEFDVTSHDAPQLGIVRKVRGRHYDIVIDASLEDCPTQATAWIVYASQRAVWRYEGKYKRYLGATKYIRTYEEDVDCYMVLAAAWEVLSKQDSTACDREYLDYLGVVADDGYLVPHVLFDHICLEDPFAARSFSNEIIDRLRSYINSYVLVPKG